MMPRCPHCGGIHTVNMSSDQRVWWCRLCGNRFREPSLLPPDHSEKTVKNTPDNPGKE